MTHKVNFPAAARRHYDDAELLTANQKYANAGLHDLAAVSIVELASTAFLFATDTAQTWQGYRLLFRHWQSYPEIARNVRERLAMVQALFPETDQARRAQRFLESSHTLFSETLYDIDDGSEMDAENFNFDLNAENAPHFPLRINWNNRFQEFDPQLIGKGLFSEAEIAACFGDFLEKAQNLIK